MPLLTVHPTPHPVVRCCNTYVHTPASTAGPMHVTLHTVLNNDMMTCAYPSNEIQCIYIFKSTIHCDDTTSGPDLLAPPTASLELGQQGVKAGDRGHVAMAAQNSSSVQYFMSKLQSTQDSTHVL